MSPIRRILTLALAGLALAAAAPALAAAATPATVRLVATDPSLGRQITITAPDGRTATGTPGLFHLRVTTAGQAPVELRGFCADLHHAIAGGTDYAVSLRTVADEPALADPRLAEAGWLVGEAEALIAAAAPARGLEAAALQVAVWQLTGQAREVDPTSDAAVNARAAALRALAAGRAAGGPLTMTPAMPRGCAAGGGVTLRLTGTPGSTADLEVTAGTGVLSASQVRFAADGTATVSVSSPVAGSVTVTARTRGGTVTRIARAGAAQTTPQETLVLTDPRTYTATATVTFEDCPLIPRGDDGPGTPGNAPSERTGSDTPVAPFEGPSRPAAPVGPSAPRTPSQRQTSGLSISKTGPARAVAGRLVRYVIRVRNTGTEPLRDVTVADALPAGTSLGRMPSGARLRGGRVEWRIASLPRGATRVLRVALRLDADVSGRRCNRVTAVAGTMRRSATACTTVTARRRPVLPAVTA